MNVIFNAMLSYSYDEDGMQPFFDETPHATPPAAGKLQFTSEMAVTSFR